MRLVSAVTRSSVEPSASGGCSEPARNPIAQGGPLRRRQPQPDPGGFAHHVGLDRPQHLEHALAVARPTRVAASPRGRRSRRGRRRRSPIRATAGGCDRSESQPARCAGPALARKSPSTTASSAVRAKARQRGSAWRKKVSRWKEPIRTAPPPRAEHSSSMACEMGTSSRLGTGVGRQVGPALAQPGEDRWRAGHLGILDGALDRGAQRQAGLPSPHHVEHPFDLGLRVAAMSAGEPLGAREAMPLLPHAQRARLNAGSLRELPDGQSRQPRSSTARSEFSYTLCLSLVLCEMRSS